MDDRFMLILYLCSRTFNKPQHPDHCQMHKGIVDYAGLIFCSIDEFIHAVYHVILIEHQAGYITVCFVHHAQNNQGVSKCCADNDKM